MNEFQSLSKQYNLYVYDDSIYTIREEFAAEVAKSDLKGRIIRVVSRFLGAGLVFFLGNVVTGFGFWRLGEVHSLPR